jgi:hypothetical protein
MGEPGSDPPALRWQTWPAKERPAAAAASALLIVLVGLAAAVFGGHIVFGLASVMILFGSLNPFFSPTSYRLDAAGVEAARWPTRKVRAWSEIRTCFIDRRGVTLSPFVGRNVLEPYRAVRLMFADNRDLVVSTLESRLSEEVRFVELVTSESGT